MISEEALRQAAAEASDCLVRSLDEAGIPVHNFSARFERKMRRLIRRTRHPAAYRALVRGVRFLGVSLGQRRVPRGQSRSPRGVLWLGADTI